VSTREIGYSSYPNRRRAAVPQTGVAVASYFSNFSRPKVGLHLAANARSPEPVVITGIGMVTALGTDRESVWENICRGESGVQRLSGIWGIPDGEALGAPVNLPGPHDPRMKTISLCEWAAEEALEDARVDLEDIDRDRFGCAISAHMADVTDIVERAGFADSMPGPRVPWWHQCLPNSACSTIANAYGLNGPRIGHSTACASGLIDIVSAVRAIQDGQCDIALAGSGESIDPLFAAGFKKMRVLANHDDPTQAARPFDSARNGFVLGEGAGMLVVERLSHAIGRRARIYAAVDAFKCLAEAHHVTGLDQESDALTYLIENTLKKADYAPADVGYINAHGTGTLQNDVTETRGIRRAFGKAADDVCVSSTKSMLGHLVNAAGSVELALTTLALRDGFAPPTRNLTDPDPQCDLDCVPITGRKNRFDRAMKLAIAFGGHLVAVALSRWNDAATGFGYPEDYQLEEERELETVEAWPRAA
jgi:3-oxoacyl-(acyl-carrier-protein) synthase